MILKKAILLAATMALAPVTGWALEVGSAVTVTGAAVAPASPQLSSPSQDVAKMAKAGMPPEVIKAYIENSPGQFNLAADNIIDLQKSGVAPGLLADMLNHDKVMRDSILAAAATQQAAPAAPANYATQDSSSVNPPAVPSDDDIYDNLSPYGSWNYQVGYGWGWQPYGWVSYSSYPWNWLGYGYWSSLPNYGWCWFPHSHFRNFNRFYGGNYAAFGGYNHFNRFPANRSAFRANVRIGGSRGVVASPFNSVPGAFRSQAGFNGRFQANHFTTGPARFTTGPTRFTTGPTRFTTGQIGFSARSGGNFHGGTHVGGGAFHGGGGFHGGGHR